MGAKTVKVLVVEDDLDMQETIQNILEREGFQLSFADTGEKMRAHIDSDRPQITLLDLMLPHDSGLDLARELKDKYKIPFIIISGKNDVIDKVVGLEIGADDYITKPFHARELTARINAVLRRLIHTAQEPQIGNTDPGIILVGDWRLDYSRQLLIQDGVGNVNLTTHEFRVLDALVSNAGNILTRDRIIDIVSGRDWMPFDRSVDVVIGKIRKKLGDDPVCPVYIKTIRNAGYSLVASVKKAPAVSR